MAIGLMVALAAASSLVFVRLSAATAEEVWRLQQDSNIAFRIIGMALRQAGARPLAAAGTSGNVEFAGGYSGYTNILNGITGAPFTQPVFYSADSALDLSRASRVQFGGGESIDVETTSRTMVYDIHSGGSGLQNNGRTPPLGLNRLKSIPRRVDWRILQ